MALATRCPHCGTTFRVAQDQLKLRAGVVRCGTCKQIFNGIESLVQPDEPDAPKAAPDTPWRSAPVVDAPWRAPAESPTPAMGPKPLDIHDIPPAAAPAPRKPADTAPVAPTPAMGPKPLDIGGVATPAPVQEPSAPEPDFSDATPELPDLAEPEAPAAPAPDYSFAGLNDDTPLHLDFNIGDDAPEQAQLHAPPAEAEPAPPAEPEDEDYTVDLAGPPARGSKQVAERARLRQQRLHAEERVPPPAPEAELPEAELADDEVPDFVRRARRQSRGATLRRRLMLIGAPLLLLLLVVQGAYLFRDRLAAAMPQTKPALARLCGVLGCRVGFPAQIEMVSLESQELQTLPSGSLVLASTLRNRSALTQAWPHLELTLTDSGDKPLARRVFRPEEYLSDPADLAKGLAPRSEFPVKVYLDAAQVKASGYRVYIFYP